MQNNVNPIKHCYIFEKCYDITIFMMKFWDNLQIFFKTDI